MEEKKTPTSESKINFRCVSLRRACDSVVKPTSQRTHIYKNALSHIHTHTESGYFSSSKLTWNAALIWRNLFRSHKTVHCLLLNTIIPAASTTLGWMIGPMGLSLCLINVTETLKPADFTRCRVYGLCKREGCRGKMFRYNNNNSNFNIVVKMLIGIWLFPKSL